MSSNDRQESENFNLEIDSAVESFFSHYEENAPKTDGSSPPESESDTISEEKKAPEADEFSPEPDFGITPEEESALEMEDSSHEPEDDIAPEAEKVAPEKQKSGSDRSAKKKFDPSATLVFNSLTEAILTIDWEVNDVNVNKAREIIENIKTDFPVLKESRAQNLIDGMLTTLDAIAASPLRVPTSAMAQLEKAIPILRGIASGAEMEDGYEALIEDAIAGLEACKAEDEPPEGIKADPSDLIVDDEISFDDGVTSKDEGLEPTAVPAGVSSALCRHSEVVAQLTPRAKKLSNQYAASQGFENVQELLQKICGLLELQTRALQGAFSLNCDIAIFPTGKINNISDFLDFQLKAMGVCLRHARVLEKAFKKHPHRKRFQQSIYFLRIAMEKQIEELSGTAWDGDAPDQETESTVPAPL
jgi:hypothetical protein